MRVEKFNLDIGLVTSESFEGDHTVFCGLYDHFSQLSEQIGFGDGSYVEDNNNFLRSIKSANTAFEEEFVNLAKQIH